MKSAPIVHYLASDAVRWQNDEYAIQQKQQSIVLPNIITNNSALTVFLMST